MILKYLIISMRPKHWIKNLFVFIPILVSGSFFDFNLIIDALFAFVSFCLASSIVYLFNDLLDIDKDKNHHVKRHRPIAKGILSVSFVVFSIMILGGIIFLVGIISTRNIILLIGGYLLLNFNYTVWLKKIPIIDILCISFGFVLRVQAGVMATGLSTSLWLISMTFTLAMLMALGKRKVELNNSNTQVTRESLKGYSKQSILSMQNIFVSSTIIFYLMYTHINKHNSGNEIFFYASSIFVILGLLRYVQLLSTDILEEEPTTLLYTDKVIIISIILWAFMIVISFL